MHISGFKIRNFKSFEDSSPCVLTEGVSVVIGQNNSGKSALLEALSLRFPNRPHGPTGPSRGASEVEIDFTMQLQELLTILARNSRTIFAPLPSNPNITDTKAYVEAPFQTNDPITLKAHVSADERILAASCLGVSANDSSGQIPCLTLTVVGNEGDLRVEYQSPSALLNNRYWPFVVASELLNRIAIVKSTNPAPGRAGIGTNHVLAADCSNLAEVLLNLQVDSEACALLNSRISEILPSVRKVSARPTSNIQAEILVWPSGTAKSGFEHARPLEDSGTGVGQVVSILYPLLTARESRILLIDEPQSFLHPGALRMLMACIVEHTDRHQFIISTNTAAVVSMAAPSSVVNVQIVEGASTASVSASSDLSMLRSTLADLGVRNSDVFGSQCVLWVEGPTEQECFSAILAHHAPMLMARTSIVPVRAVDELVRSDASQVFDLYRRLSSAPTLLPPAVAFVFDREDRSNEIREGMRRRNSRVEFISRRMYENYLINENAVAALCNALPDFGSVVTPQVVAQWFQANGRMDKYGVEPTVDDRTWEETVRADKLLDDLIGDLSGHRHKYRKREYGLMLTKWLLVHEPDALREVAELVQSCVGSNESTS